MTVLTVHRNAENVRNTVQFTMLKCPKDKQILPTQIPSHP